MANTRQALARTSTNTSVAPAISFESIADVTRSLESRCHDVWCIFSRSTCCARRFRDDVCSLFGRDAGGAKAIVATRLIVDTAIRVENRFYWLFYADRFLADRAADIYREFLVHMDRAMKGLPLDQVHRDGPNP